MSVEPSVACKRCGSTVVGTSPRFCSRCGFRLIEEPSRPALWTGAKLVPPLIALCGSLLSWVRVAALPANRNGWNVYHFGNAGWSWLVGDIVALLIVLAALVRPSRTPSWLWTAWKIFGGLSLGMALSAVVFVSMGSTIAGLVNAPNPLTLASGALVFGIGCLLWVGLSFAPAP